MSVAEHKTGNTNDKARQRKSVRAFAVQSQREFLSGNSGNKGPVKCPSCGKNHWLSQCNDFKKLRVSDRYKLVYAKKLCCNCLVAGHFAKDCPKKSFCRIQGCTKKHSTFLHAKEDSMEPKIGGEVNDGNINRAEPAENAAQVNNAYVQGETFQSSSSPSVVGLSILPVRVRGKGQKKHVVTYAFLDSGSNTSFCTESLLRKLREKKPVSLLPQ